METPIIRSYATPYDVAKAVADEFLAYTTSCIAETGNCIVALSGGTTPNELFGILNTDAYRNEVDWENIRFIWVDERYIPQTNPDNNYYKAKDILFSKLSGCAHTVPIPTNLGTVEEVAAFYEKDINTVLKACDKEAPDLVLLGLGDDGHTASLFPKSTALHVRDKKVAYVKDGKVWERITLTLPFLIASKATWFTVVGLKKQAALSRVLSQSERYREDSWEDRVDRTLPAAILPLERAIFFVDEEAYPQ